MNGRTLKRRKNALILQPRDIDILLNVFSYRFLTSGQARALSDFNSQKRANDRLRKLFDAGYLSRRIFNSAFKKELLCFLGPKAIELVALKTGADPLEIRKKRMKALKTRDSFLPHFLSINNFRFSLETAGRVEPPVKLDYWKYKPPLFLDGEHKIFPDAYFIAKCDGKTRLCFLEIDRSVESRQRIQKKIENYLDYGLNGDFERQFHFKHFRLMIVCKTSARLKTLRKIIEKASDQPFGWLAVEKNIAPERILSKIWYRANKEGEFSLIE